MPPHQFNAELRRYSRQYTSKVAARSQKTSALVAAMVLLPRLSERSVRRRLRQGGELPSSRSGIERRGRPRLLTDGETRRLYDLWELNGSRWSRLFKADLPRLSADAIDLGMEGHGAAFRQKVLGLSLRSLQNALNREMSRRGRKPRGNGFKRVSAALANRETVVKRERGAGPGVVDTDTVFNCGGRRDRPHAYTGMTVCVYSSWLGIFAARSLKSEDFVLPWCETLRRFPFRVIGARSDRGTEFVCEQMGKVFDREGIKGTVGRCGKCNDNPLAEQKNGDVIRKTVGYGWIDSDDVGALNEVYRLLERQRNYFCSSVKLESSRRDGAKVVRAHDDPRTPLDRLVGWYREQGKRLPKALGEHVKARKNLNSITAQRELDAAMLRLEERLARRSRMEALKQARPEDVVNV